MKKKEYHSSFTTRSTPKEAFDEIRRISEWWATGLEGKSRNLDDLFTERAGETFLTFGIVENLAEASRGSNGTAGAAAQDAQDEPAIDICLDRGARGGRRGASIAS